MCIWGRTVYSCCLAMVAGEYRSLVETMQISQEDQNQPRCPESERKKEREKGTGGHWTGKRETEQFF